MNPRSAQPRVVGALLLVVAGQASAVLADDPSAREISQAFAPFEYLLGRWHGQGMPKDNPAQQFRGWSESHAWAWFFTAGKPAGLSITIEGGKIFTAAKLTYDPAKKLYRLRATEPRPGGTVTYEGTLDRSGKQLVLERVVEAGRPAHTGKVRLTVWPNANFIRYTMAEDIQEPGAFQFHRAIEVGLTRDGESLAGVGGAAAERPKCIVTGGAAAMTVSYQGKTFPICCTGCRDEFNENPEKYLKKAAAMLNSPATPKTNQPAASRVSRFDDAFANDVVDTPASDSAGKSQQVAAKPLRKAEAGPASRANGPSTTAQKQKADSTPASKTNDAAAATRKAASLLKLGQNLEKADKTTAALGYYRQVVKDYPGTPAAKTAAERIKALEPR